MPSGSIPRWGIAACALATLVCCGCAPYRFGADSLYPADIRSVHVPVFESESFRPGIGELLTEAVTKQILLKTTFKLANSARADSVLVGRVLSDSKRVLIENENDEPRVLQVGYLVDVQWIDRRGEQVRPGVQLALPPVLAQAGGSSVLIPEAGQSYATAQVDAVEKLAVQIVELLESRW